MPNHRPSTRKVGRPVAWPSLLEQVLASTTAAVVIADARAPDEPITYVNAAFEHLTGYVAADVAGHSLLRLLSGGEPDQPALSELRAALRTHQPQRVALRSARKDGRTLWTELMLSPVRDDRGEVTHHVGVLHDISAQVQTETALRLRAGQLHALGQAALAITAAPTLETTLQEITNQARTIIGAHQVVTSLTVSDNWTQAINALWLSDKYAAWRDFDERPDGSGIYTYVCETNRPMRLTQAELEAHPRWRGFSWAAGKHPPLRGWLAAPLIGRDGQNIGLIQLSDKLEGEFTREDEAILVQLAQLAAVAIENARLRQAAEEAVRARDQFLMTAAHELRTPATVVKAMVQVVLRAQARGDLTTEQQSSYLSAIDRATNRLVRLVGDLLDVARLVTGRLVFRRQPLDLAVLAETVIAQYQERLGPQHQLTLRASKAPLVLVDPDRLEQVLTNLLDNAVTYSPEGGHVAVEVAPVTDGVRLTVTDQGIGLPLGSAEAIFEPFSRAANAAQRQLPGLGLGLAISRQIIEQHGGRIWAESSGEGEGTMVLVWLPEGTAIA